MWRAFFLALGAMLVIVGVETLVIESATIYSASGSTGTELANTTGAPTRVVKPEEWMPWTAMSIGTIVVLYAFTLPQRWKTGG